MSLFLRLQKVAEALAIVLGERIPVQDVLQHGCKVEAFQTLRSRGLADKPCADLDDDRLHFEVLDLRLACRISIEVFIEGLLDLRGFRWRRDV